MKETDRLGDSPESQPVEPENGVESASVDDEAEVVLARKDEQLDRASARIAELESVISDKDGEIRTLKQSVTELETNLATTRDSLGEAVDSYREIIIRANPDIVEEMISGDSIESLNKSLEKARGLVDRVRQGLEAETIATRVPSGSPERRSPDLSALSPREKIKYAIGGKG